MKNKKYSAIQLKKVIKRAAILSIAFFSLIACDDDYNEVGSAIVDGNNFTSIKYDNAAISAHSVKITGVQSNGLSSYALGVYNDAKYGQLTANVLAQLSLPIVNPNFGKNPILDSVILQVPYYSTVTEQTADGKKYELDSVYGSNPVKLAIYRSGYYLRKYDPTHNFGTQAYYSDEGSKFEQHLVGSPLYTDSYFTPSNQPIVISQYNSQTQENDTTVLTPRLRVHLPVSYFKTAIMDKEGGSQLMTNDNFQNYFRGLYFKTGLINAIGVGAYSLLNFGADDAGITLYYRSEVTSDSGTTNYIHRTYKINFATQLVNVFQSSYTSLPTSTNDLYVKGGQGSMAVINLFTDPQQLDSIRDAGWLINEANLTFYVDKNAMPSTQDNPERLFIYDIKNDKVLKDYTLDGGVNNNDPLNSRTVHLGRLTKDDQGNLYYKIRITNYVNDIINNDSTNTRLGLVVSQNVNISTKSRVKVDSSTVITSIKTVPTSSVLAPKGTVLFGPNATSPQALKLVIFYTKSK